MLVLLGEIGLRAQTLTVPALSGEDPEPAVGAEARRENFFTAGLRLSTEFDDNALNDDRSKQSNLLSAIEPHIGWNLFSTRANWTLDYRRGFTVGYPLSLYNSHSQLLDTKVQMKLTKRLRVHLRENILQSKNVFDQLQQSDIVPGSNAVDHPNNSILTTSREN